MSVIGSQFLDKIKKFRSGEYAFRGQANADWELRSAATRRLENMSEQYPDINELSEVDFQHIYRKYHYDELINPARTFGFDIEDGVKISDLRLLAKLQHFGTATGLIDFTWNPLVALWFACENERDNGKVFLVNLNDTSKYESPSPSSEEEESIKYLFPSDKSKLLHLYWEPNIRSEASARILRQHSVFVLPRSPVMKDGVQDIVIESQHKKEIMDELAGLGISEQSLFLDIHGFSTTNRANSPIRKMNDPHVDFMQGNKFYQQGDYVNAIEYYTQCIKAILGVIVREPYYLRGNAQAASGDYEKAIEDYDFADKGTIMDMMSYRESMKENVTVCDLERDRPWIFFNRGNAKSKLKKYECAIQDYNNAVDWAEKLNFQSDIAMIKFNRANAKVASRKYSEAIKDYDEIINTTPEDSACNRNSLFNKGNTLIIAHRFQEALECYRKAMQAGYSGAQNNMKNLERLIQNIGKVNGSIRVVVEIKDGSGTNEEFSFGGNVGNTGNFGGNRLPGGEGYSGGPSFLVKVKAMK